MPMNILPLPQPGSGAIYRVIAVTNTQAADPMAYPVTVVYHRLQDESDWSRPASEWHAAFEPLGEVVAA